MAKAGTPGTGTGKFVYDEEALKTRFHQITREKEAIYAKAAPTRAKYDDVRKREDALVLERLPLQKDLKEIQAPLYELSQEQAAIARLLRGKTGPDPVVIAQQEQAEDDKAKALALKNGAPATKA